MNVGTDAVGVKMQVGRNLKLTGPRRRWKDSLVSGIFVRFAQA
jgi:hypothetical protein